MGLSILQFSVLFLLSLTSDVAISTAVVGSINASYPGLESFSASVKAGDLNTACEELVTYYQKNTKSVRTSTLQKCPACTLVPCSNVDTTVKGNSRLHARGFPVGMAPMDTTRQLSVEQHEASGWSDRRNPGRYLRSDWGGGVPHQDHQEPRWWDQLDRPRSQVRQTRSWPCVTSACLARHEQLDLCHRHSVSNNTSRQSWPSSSSSQFVCSSRSRGSVNEHQTYVSPPAPVLSSTVHLTC